MLSKEAVAFIKKQRLGYIATVNPDNTPNISPKGSLTVWDEKHLIFVDLASPDTIRNLQINANAEINFVDVFTRKGFLIRGICTIFSEKNPKNPYRIFYEKMGYSGYVEKIKHYVLIEIKEVMEIYSPAYDNGETEQSLKNYFRKYYKD